LAKKSGSLVNTFGESGLSSSLRPASTSTLLPVAGSTGSLRPTFCWSNPVLITPVPMRTATVMAPASKAMPKSQQQAFLHPPVFSADLLTYIFSPRKLFLCSLTGMKYSAYCFSPFSPGLPSPTMMGGLLPPDLCPSSLSSIVASSSSGIVRLTESLVLLSPSSSSASKALFVTPPSTLWPLLLPLLSSSLLLLLGRLSVDMLLPLSASSVSFSSLAVNFSSLTVRVRVAGDGQLSMLGLQIWPTDAAPVSTVSGFGEEPSVVGSTLPFFSSSVS